MVWKRVPFKNKNKISSGNIAYLISLIHLPNLCVHCNLRPVAFHNTLLLRKYFFQSLFRFFLFASRVLRRSYQNVQLVLFFSLVTRCSSTRLLIVD